MNHSADRDEVMPSIEAEEARFSTASEHWFSVGQHLSQIFAQATDRIREYALAVETRQAEIELKTRREAIDLEACLRRMTQDGVEVLTPRERRSLLLHPDRVPARAAKQIIDAENESIRYVLRACLANWQQCLMEKWGQDYVNLLTSSAVRFPIPFLEENPVALLALCRTSPTGDERLAEAIPVELSAAQAYDYLRQSLGLRDSWVYTGCVLASWLQVQVTHQRSIDDAFETIRRNARLKAHLLPNAAQESPPPGVRNDTLTRARAVSALLRAAFARPPQLSGKLFAELSEYLLGSSFGDPRIPPLDEGWQEVRASAPEPFRDFLASLCAQDLEVFFGHAMNAADRRRFWTRYLRSIERTGCVLDRGSQQRLKTKLQASAELKSAIARAYTFRRSSNVHAFFLVFPKVVVVEFSDVGNAAYVYRRKDFERKLEPAIREHSVESVRDLKKTEDHIHRITHQSSWEDATERWLSENGIHASPGRGRS